MKKCLQCDQVYGDDTNFCLSDGSTLVPASDSFSSQSETPTVFRGAPPPTVFSNSQFTQPISYQPPAPAPQKSHTLLIALVVGFFALIIGGTVVGLAVYFLSNPGGKDGNVATLSNSNDKSNKSTEQKSDNSNLAQNSKQDKSDKDKQNKNLDIKKVTPTPTPTPIPTPTPNSTRTATVIDPPTNIRLSPNGTILCVVKQRTTVNITGSTNVSDNNGTWYYTDACGRTGVIHSSQIRF